MKISIQSQQLIITILIIVQIACGAYFIYDVTHDLLTEHTNGLVYLIMETLAILSFFVAAGLEYVLMSRQAKLLSRAQRSLSVARGKVQDIIQNYFDTWNLTKAEAEVATLAIKGFSISEIAGFRQAQEGTIKTQLTSVYRKAGVAGRNQLGSLLIEDLMGENAV